MQIRHYRQLLGERKLCPMFEELSSGVFRRRFPFLRTNVGVVVGEEGVLLIDTRESHEAANELTDELRYITEKPVRWILNTHWHWDHVFGNACYPEAAVWGHRRCRTALRDFPDQHRDDARKWMPPQRFDEIERVRIVPPDCVFEAVASIDIGGRKVEAAYHGRGHTDADIVIHCGDVTFIGDLVEEGEPPKMGDSHPLDWPATLATARPSIRPVVVPGHGHLLTPEDVDEQRHILAEVAELLRQVLHEGRPATDAIRDAPIPEPDMHQALARARSLWRSTG